MILKQKDEFSMLEIDNELVYKTTSRLGLSKETFIDDRIEKYWKTCTVVCLPFTASVVFLAALEGEAALVPATTLHLG